MARILDWGMVCDRGRTRAENQDATFLWTPELTRLLPFGDSSNGSHEPESLTAAERHGPKPESKPESKPEPVSVPEPVPCCAVVADGMGGQRGGDEASRLIVETAARVLPRMSQEEPQAALGAFLSQVNEEVYAHARRRDLVGMGSTCTVLCVVGERAHLGHVGDSRCYVLRAADRVLRQWSEDQNLAGQLVRQGVLTPEDALHHRSSHVLTQAIGLGKPIEPQLDELELGAGEEIFMLTSDGLLRVVTEREIAQALEFYLDRSERTEPDRPFLQQAAEDLLALANDRGSPDNVSILLLGLRSEKTS